MRIDFRDIRKSYGRKLALNVGEWAMQEGEVLGLVGSNGAGKTTFLRLLLDLIRPDTGEVLLDGRNVSEDASWRARTGSYLDRGFLIDYLTIREYCEFVGSAYGLSREETSRSLARFDAFLPVSRADASRLIRDLSTGNAKKVGITAALMVRPELIVLDEPFANLDPPSQIRLKGHLQDMASAGTTMLISSHDLGHVTDVCRRITLIEGGHIVRDTATSGTTLSELQEYFAEERESDIT